MSGEMHVCTIAANVGVKSDDWC